MSSNDVNPVEMDYVKSHVNAWILDTTRMRAVGFQWFIAIQGGLMVALANLAKTDSNAFLWMPVVLGLASCLSFYLWDRRNRFVFRSLHAIGARLVDRRLFGSDSEGKAVDGVHELVAGLQSEHEKWLPSWASLSSHTWAIRILTCTCAVCWVIVGVNLTANCSWTLPW